MQAARKTDPRVRTVDLVLPVGFAGLVGAVILLASRPLLPAQILAAIAITVLTVHAVIGLGRVEAALFALICLVVTFAIENLGVATGFPFGPYHFRVAPDLPHVGAIPIIVGPLYFGMGYAAWVIACLILGRPGMRPDDRFGLVALPVVAAFAMVQWDVVMDPPDATLWQAWVWHRGGGFFGVPLTNFLGWFLTVWLYFQLFALVVHRRRPRGPARSRAFWLVPILLYLASGLSHIPPWLMDADARLVDGGGRIWSAADLQESTVVVMLFTMLPTSVLALLRLYDGPAGPTRRTGGPSERASEA